MRRLPIWTIAISLATSMAMPAAAQTGWSRDVTDYGAYYSSERSDSMVVVLLLWEIDQKTGSNLLGMPESASGEVIEQALSAMPFKIEQIVSEDVSNQRMPKMTGYANTPQGRKAFAATISNRGVSRRLVVLLDESANISKLLRRIGSVSNFRSTIAAADRPGWVPGQGASQTRSSSSASAPSRASNRPIRTTSTRQRTARPRSNYRLPTDQSDFNKWPMTKPITFSPNISDPLAPRGYRGVTGPDRGVTTFNGALQDMLGSTDIKLAGKPIFRKLQAWADYDGRQARLVMVPTNRGGHKGVLMVYLVSPKGSPRFSALGYEVPEQTFLDGGGIIRMLMIRGIVPNANVFPANQQSRIARAPFKQQMDFYDAALTKLYERRKRQFIASQSAVSMRMMELNYDLLLGGDISSPFIAD